MESNEDEVLTTAEASQVLKCSKARLEIWRHEGIGPPFTRMGRLIRYRRSRLLQWMTENEIPDWGKPKTKVEEEAK